MLREMPQALRSGRHYRRAALRGLLVLHCRESAVSLLFLGVQGGAQTTFTNYDNMKLITPTTSLSFGAFFTPVVGCCPSPPQPSRLFMPHQAV